MRVPIEEVEKEHLHHSKLICTSCFSIHDINEVIDEEECINIDEFEDISAICPDCNNVGFFLVDEELADIVSKMLKVGLVPEISYQGGTNFEYKVYSWDGPYILFEMPKLSPENEIKFISALYKYKPQCIDLTISHDTGKQYESLTDMGIEGLICESDNTRIYLAGEFIDFGYTSDCSQPIETNFYKLRKDHKDKSDQEFVEIIIDLERRFLINYLEEIVSIYKELNH